MHTFTFEGQRHALALVCSILCGDFRLKSDTIPRENVYHHQRTPFLSDGAFNKNGYTECFGTSTRADQRNTKRSNRTN
jgi:hypothetical protein